MKRILAGWLRPRHVGRRIVIKGRYRKPGIAGTLEKVVRHAGVWPAGWMTLTIDGTQRSVPRYRAVLLGKDPNRGLH